MGLHFGNLYKLRGIVTYKLSPYEQRAFAGLFKQGIPNVIRRTKDQVLYVLPRESQFFFNTSLLHLCEVWKVLLSPHYFYSFIPPSPSYASPTCVSNISKVRI
uniref:Cytochrome b-c1 complex subunit 8 n=1 Tax=Rhipicephalus microplus TaxID=6941 RepID=A0A6M2CJA2_RHIMP